MAAPPPRDTAATRHHHRQTPDPTRHSTRRPRVSDPSSPQRASPRRRVMCRMPALIGLTSPLFSVRGSAQPGGAGSIRRPCFPVIQGKTPMSSEGRSHPGLRHSASTQACNRCRDASSAYAVRADRSAPNSAGWYESLERRIGQDGPLSQRVRERDRHCTGGWASPGRPRGRREAAV